MFEWILRFHLRIYMQRGWSALCYNIYHVVQQYRACVVDLLELGIHSSVVRITLLCIQPIPILCLSSFCAIPIFHLLNFSFTCPLSFYVMIVEGILCIRFVHMCVTDSIVRKCGPVKD